MFTASAEDFVVILTTQDSLSPFSKRSQFQPKATWPAKAASVLSLRYLGRSSSTSLRRARLLRTERRLASTVRRERPALTLWPSKEKETP